MQCPLSQVRSLQVLQRSVLVVFEGWIQLPNPTICDPSFKVFVSKYPLRHFYSHRFSVRRILPWKRSEKSILQLSSQRSLSAKKLLKNVTHVSGRKSSVDHWNPLATPCHFPSYPASHTVCWGICQPNPSLSPRSSLEKSHPHGSHPPIPGHFG